MKHDVTSITRTVHTVVITAQDLFKWLSRKERAGPDCRATIQVPGGGDYSNMTLDLDEVGGITVTWTEECTS